MELDGVTLTLQAAVFAAALLQAATGIGFGVLAGPVILIALNSGSAVQVTILLSLLIAAVLTPTLYRQVDSKLLVRLSIGTLIGAPIGILVFLQVSFAVLMLLAALAVLSMALSLWRPQGPATRNGRTDSGSVQDLAVGVLSGAMSASLAMPGPAVAARMSALAFPKETIRATVLASFIFSYAIAFAFQAGLAGLARETWSLTASLIPATLIGVLLGRLLAAKISERSFHRLVGAILLATAASLFVKSAILLMSV